MAKTSKQSQIESLQIQLADTQAQLEAERNTILSLESTIAEYEQAMSVAAAKTVEFAIKATSVVAAKSAEIGEISQELTKTEGQLERAVKLATDLSATLVQAAVYGTKA